MFYLKLCHLIQLNHGIFSWILSYYLSSDRGIMFSNITFLNRLCGRFPITLHVQKIVMILCQWCKLKHFVGKVLYVWIKLSVHVNSPVAFGSFKG